MGIQLTESLSALNVSVVQLDGGPLLLTFISFITVEPLALFGF